MSEDNSNVTVMAGARRAVPDLEPPSSRPQRREATQEASQEAQDAAPPAPKPPAPKAPKPPREPKPPKEPGAPKTSRFEKVYPDTHVIVLLCNANPKRAGSEAHRRFELYRTGMTIAEWKKALDSRWSDLSWNIGHGYMKVVPPEEYGGQSAAPPTA
jgi:hypothetical protein